MEKNTHNPEMDKQKKPNILKRVGNAILEVYGNTYRGDGYVQFPYPGAFALLPKEQTVDEQNERLATQKELDDFFDDNENIERGRE